MCVRAGLTPNAPMTIQHVDDGMAFASLRNALQHANAFREGALIVALQKPTPYRRFDVSGGGDPLEGGFQVPLTEVDVRGTTNFASLLGTSDEWYWEDATRSWIAGGIVRHRQADEEAMRLAQGYVIFAVIPNTPASSPMLGAYLPAGLP